MSGEQGGTRRGGRGRGKGRGRGRGGRGRSRGSEQRQSESGVPGGVQQPKEEERGATALPVSRPSEEQPKQLRPSFEQSSRAEQTPQKRGQTPRKHGKGKRSEQTTQQREQRPEQPEMPPGPEQQPTPQPAAVLQQPGTFPTEREEGYGQKQQSKQQDRPDGAFPTKPTDETTSASRDVGGPITTPVSPPPTSQQQSSRSQPSGKQQRRATQQQIPIQQQQPGPPQSEKSEIKPPLRPDRGGTVGRPIRLRVNFLPVELPLNDIHHYDAEIIAKVKPKGGDGYTKSEAPKIISKMVKQYEKENPSGPKIVYDSNGKNLYCRTPIPGIGKDRREFKVTFTTDNDKEREYTVVIQWASQVSLYLLNEALEGRLTEIPRDTFQAVQTVIRYLPSMSSIPVGESFFSYPDGNEKDLGFGLQIWNGRFVSIRPTQWKMMLNVDTCSTAFYKAQPVLDFLCEFLQLRNIPAKLNRGQCKLFGKEMNTIKIETTHAKRKQRVTGISQKSSKEERFSLEDGKMVSVFDYFKSKYGITLKYPDLPCLKIGQKKSLLPMELCNIMEGQRHQGRLTADQTREMIRHTALPAPQRQQEINRLIRDANFDQDPYCRDFGIKVGKDMATVTGRILDPPMLNYGPSSQPHKERPRDGVWNMQNKPMFTPKELNEWAIISYENPKFFDERATDNFINRLVMAGKEKQLRIHSSPCYRATKRGPEGIQHLFDQLHKNYPNLQLVILIFPGRGNTDEFYEGVKRYGDVVYGIRTQCIKAGNAKKADMQTLANICLKINAKLGGTTSVLDKGIRSPILKSPVIIFGADVTHTPGDMTSPSVAAVVASMDSHPNLYSAEVRLQTHREGKKTREIITELKDMVKILLKKFRESTGVKPEKIIFYRDGVSEGQFREVLLYELQAFQQACRDLHPSYQPQITIIVVQKRHHARFFAEDRQDQRGKSKNIPAGTVVDTKVCHPFEFDWYLCSHAGIQGTSKPAHYHVLYDDSNFKSDDLQILTNQLCHTYVRCARAVSIPAPVYYAHHVAFRARYHLKEVDRESSEGSTASGGEDTSLPKEEMVQAVKIHERMSSTMYFA